MDVKAAKACKQAPTHSTCLARVLGAGLFVSATLLAAGSAQAAPNKADARIDRDEALANKAEAQLDKADAQANKVDLPVKPIRWPIIDPIMIVPASEHPAFTVKRRDPVAYRVAAQGDQEDICAGSGDLQHVREYDGTLGQTRAFVDAHKGPVGRLTTAEWCSGTLIARNLFLTASHCVDNLVSQNFVEFNYEKLPGSNDIAPVTRYQMLEVVEDGVASDIDYAIVRLADNVGAANPNPGDSFGYTLVDPFPPSISHLITIIQHPDGDPKQVEVGHIHHYDTQAVYYDDLDTRGGSSGSGILDDVGRLVGVHTNGGCAAGEQNAGMRMDRIVSVSATIRSLLPPTILARIARIRSLHVHDVGTTYGESNDQIDLEAVVLLEGSDETFAFTLRTGTDAAAHRQMLGMIRKAFVQNLPIRLEYDRQTHRTNRVFRVIRY
jgi:V8-like Glu-specific endopeptidase